MSMTIEFVECMIKVNEINDAVEKIEFVFFCAPRRDELNSYICKNIMSSVMNYIQY